MASTSSPYGLRPLNMLGGQARSGATRQYAIKSAYSVAIQYGDPVLLTAGADGTGGFINRFNGTTTATTATTSGMLIGVFVGCTWTDSTVGPTFRQCYPGSVTASDIMAYVVDDPDALFMAQFNGAATRNYLNSNCGLIQTVAGSATANRISGVGLSLSSAAATATLPIRVVDFVIGPNSAVGDAYTDVIVRINTHAHKSGAAGVLGNAIA